MSHRRIVESHLIFVSCVATGIALSAWCPLALAAESGDDELIEADPESEQGQRSFGFGPTGGAFTGFGGGLRIGSDYGVEAYGGWLPLVLTTKHGDSSDFDFNNTLMFSVHAYAVVLAPTEQSSIGVLAGYKYNDLLGHGGAFGGYGLLDLNRSLVLHLTGGVLFFPDGEDSVREHDNVAPDATYGFPGPFLQVGANIGLMLFL